MSLKPTKLPSASPGKGTYEIGGAPENERVSFLSAAVIFG
jgi:hypothetical protein